MNPLSVCPSPTWLVSGLLVSGSGLTVLALWLSGALDHWRNPFRQGPSTTRTTHPTRSQP